MIEWIESMVKEFYEARDNSTYARNIAFSPFGLWQLRRTDDDDILEPGMWFHWQYRPLPMSDQRSRRQSKTFIYVDVDDEAELRKQIAVFVKDVWSVFTVEEKLDAVHG